MWPDLPRPVVFAHRGASAHAPENTLAAFALAGHLGAPAIEFDVKLSRDGHVVVIHDPTVDRTTDGHGRVHEMTLADLRALDAGAKFSAECRGERIPTLDEVFEMTSKKLFMNVELTNYATPFDGLVDAVAGLVKRHGTGKRVMFSSFSPANLFRAWRLLPDAPRGQLSLPGASGAWQRAAGSLIPVQAEHPFYADVTARTVGRAHARGRRVHVWTVNDPAEMRRLFALGADGIFTDDPALGLGILQEAQV